MIPNEIWAALAALVLIGGALFGSPRAAAFEYPECIDPRGTEQGSTRKLDEGLWFDESLPRWGRELVYRDAPLPDSVRDR